MKNLPLPLCALLSMVFLMGAPCPGLEDEPECESDSDCGDAETCEDDKCESILSSSADDRLCVVNYTCAEDADPEKTCADAKKNRSEEDIACRGACATELEAFSTCALDNGECIDAVYQVDVEEGGVCQASQDVAVACVQNEC